jgi:NTE family protein
MAGGLAVVLSGGGAKGAFQVGVLHELIVNRGVKIDIFAGVSTGAIQALGGAQDDVPGLLAAWLALTGNKDVFKKGGGLLAGVLGADSLYDATPIRTRIRAFADEAKLRATGKKLLLGVVNLGTGQFRSIDESVPRIADWVYASAAMPVFFQPYLTRHPVTGIDEQWVDGGVRNVTPLDDAMQQNPRALLVVRASPPPEATPPGKTYDNLIKIGLRAVSILQSEVSANDTGNAMLINDLIAAREGQVRALASAGVTGAAAARVLAPLDQQLAKYRFAPIRIIAPETEISETLEFDPVKIRAGIDAGRQAVTDHWPSLRAFLGV